MLLKDEETNGWSIGGWYRLKKPHVEQWTVRFLGPRNFLAIFIPWWSFLPCCKASAGNLDFPTPTSGFLNWPSLPAQNTPGHPFTEYLFIAGFGPWPPKRTHKLWNLYHIAFYSHSRLFKGKRQQKALFPHGNDLPWASECTAAWLETAEVWTTTVFFLFKREDWYLEHWSLSSECLPWANTEAEFSPRTKMADLVSAPRGHAALCPKLCLKLDF